MSKGNAVGNVEVAKSGSCERARIEGVHMKQRPFLKWAGNKYHIIERIRKMLPNGNRLIEPFVGSGAVFLNTDFDEYVLADTNEDLINLYSILKEEDHYFIEYAKGFFTCKSNSEENYYAFRELFNSSADKRLKAALLIYLNKHGYNGLCRYNSKGRFNTPFGRYKAPYFPQKEMAFFSKKAKEAALVVADFENTMELAKTGDVIYCDPPYVPLSPTAHFTSYSAGSFGLNEQRRLANKAREMALRGIPVLISNHHTDFVLDIYYSAKIATFEVQRFISCDGSNRGKASEVLALFERSI